jgi:hypothetical protein
VREKRVVLRGCESETWVWRREAWVLPAPSTMTPSTNGESSNGFDARAVSEARLAWRARAPPRELAALAAPPLLLRCRAAAWGQPLHCGTAAPPPAEGRRRALRR